MLSHEDFIVELGTEELPPLSLSKLARSFHDSLVKQIDEAGLSHQQTHFYATPRRLTVVVNQLATAQQDKTIDKQGPAVVAAFDQEGKPTPAANGFAKSCGVSIDEIQRVETTKGLRLSFQIKEKGKASEQLLPDLVQAALAKLPIAKAMRWGNNSHSFIRPVKWLLMMQGESVVPCSLYNCQSSNITHGHRFHAAGDLVLSSANEYLELLENHFVIADIEKRKNIILEQICELADKMQAQAVIDPSLLDEVTALVEWPVALAGEFDKAFLNVPQEALISTMATNQKYFHLKDKNQQLLAKFITIANVQSFNPAVVIAGNERVIRPRLADAMFFFEKDCKHSLASIVNRLNKVVFQKELGTVLDKTLRIKALATKIASELSMDNSNIEQAATICKSDLLTEMVGEFPSLQGIMGRYYAINDGENSEVANAMDEIYMPRFSGDKLPTGNAGICLALADRLDTLVGIFAIGQVPTGNKDPFALRRAALGILRIIIEKQLPLDLLTLINFAADQYSNITIETSCIKQINNFFSARLKAMYLDKDFSSPIIQSVQALNISTPLEFDARIKAVQEFNKIQQAASLSESNKRVANILNKNAVDLDLKSVDKSLLTEDAEKELSKQIERITPEVSSLCTKQQYHEAFKYLAELKPAIDTFFDSVMVMDEDKKLRDNRLALLQQLRDLFLTIADISYLQK